MALSFGSTMCRKVLLHNKHMGRCLKLIKCYLTQSQIHTPILKHLSVSSSVHGFPVFSFSSTINTELSEAGTL